MFKEGSSLTPYQTSCVFPLSPASEVNKLKSPSDVLDTSGDGRAIIGRQSLEGGNVLEVIAAPSPSKPTVPTVLEFPHQRLCSCSLNHIGCSSPKDWIKAQIGVWQFTYEQRDIRDKNVHPATFPIALPKRWISLLTHRGGLVLDPFVGSGTTLIAARDTERNAVGFDLNDKYIQLAQHRISQLPLDGGTAQLPVVADARDISQYLLHETVDLIVTSPPYANLLNRPRKNKSRRGDERRNGQYLRIEQYSTNPHDLGLLGIREYQDAMKEIFAGLLPLLKPGAHCVINVPDMWWENQRVTIHIAVIQALTNAGYEFRNTVIWDRTNIVNRVGIFGWPNNYITMGTTFEYLLDFRRPLRE